MNILKAKANEVFFNFIKSLLSKRKIKMSSHGQIIILDDIANADWMTLRRTYNIRVTVSGPHGLAFDLDICIPQQ